MDMVSVPFTEILKVVISEAKKVKDFKPLFKELTSTIERLVPIFEEMDLLQERLDPGNKELIFLTKLMLRAKKMVRKCSEVRVYNILKKNSYTKKIKKINEDFVKFCQLDLQLIQHRDQLRSRSQTRLNMDKTPPPPPSLEGEQRVIWESFNDKGKGKQAQVDEELSIALRESQNMEELSSREAEELQKAIQESIIIRRQQRNLQEDEEQRILWESFKDNGKRKRLQEDELVAVALQESLNSSKDNGKRKQVQEDELVAVAIQESLNSLKDNKRRKQVQEDELVARGLQERINNGSSSFTRAHSFNEDDIQWVLLESLTKKQRKSI